jgi:hypothetical protein
VEDPPRTWRSRLRRWRWWIAAVVLIVAVRVALPVVLRRVIVSQASQALHARVDVGDVDLALWKGGVALKDVAVRAISTGPSTGSGRTEKTEPSGPESVRPRPVDPAQGTPVEGHPDSPPAAFPADAPLVAFKRFAVELRYWPLFSKTIQLRDIELVSPRVALDRLASGDLNLTALMPQSEVAVAAGATPGAGEAGATPTPTVATGEATPSPWKLGLDRFVLRDGRLRFRDLKLKGSEPVEVGIDEVTVQEIALGPGVYGEPAHLHVKLGVDTGAIDVAAQLRLLDKGFAVTCDLNAQRLPLRRARLYIPKVGWSDLKGELDLALVYELETDVKNALHGTLALRDVAVAVPKLEGVAVGWKSLDVKVDTIDLMAQRAALAEVNLDGAVVDVRAHGDQPLPVLAEYAPPAGEDTPQPTPSAEASPSPTAEPNEGEAEPPEPAKPWDWSVASVHISNSIVRILSDQPPLEIGLDLTASNLAGAADAIAHVALALAPPQGAVKIEGDLRIAAPAFGGTIQIADLALPPLVAVSGAVEPGVLPSATFKADLAVQAGLPATSGATAEPDLLRITGSLGLSDARVSPPGQSELTVESKAIDLAVTELAVPGVIPVGQKAAPGAALRVAADLTLQEPRVTRTGEQAMSFAAQSIGLGLSDVSVPAGLAGLGPADAAQPIHAVAQLDLATPHIALPGAELTAEAQAISLAVSEATITAVPAGAGAAGAAPAHVVAQLALSEPKAAIAEGRQLAAGAQVMGLQVSELTLPGLVVGAPPADTGQPLHAVATLTLVQPRALRGDGKEFSVTAKSIAVPVTDLSVPGALAAATDATQPLRAALADVRIDAPAMRITRTKDGIVLPVAASAPPPPAKPAAVPAAPPAPAPVEGGGSGAPPPQLTVASFRLTNGSLDFTDRAVQPVFQTRYAPIEIDARNIHFPDPSVKPLRIDITSAEQGRLVVSGDLDPQSATLELKMDDFALAPFNSYATTYSPYGISDGALEIRTTAKFSGGKYDVSNAITLHQFDLSGAEGDSLFEQQFGIPLTMALALLRDASGDIDLNIPVQVDQSGGATVDILTVVRSALRQAMMGAIESPLKLVGGVIGVGGKSGSIAPAPIAFPLGGTEPTSAGAESAQRLASFLTSRPAMAVQLDTAVTPDDVRWLREQALHGEWQDEGFVKRSFAFITQRGPRERIGDYLRARADGNTPELSAEDAATLQRWLDERPPPSAEQLRGLAAARLAAVESALREQGIDPGRITHGEPSGEPAEGAPVVKIKFQAASGPSRARSAPSTNPEEGR